MKKSLTLIEQACSSVPKFNELYQKLQRNIELNGKRLPPGREEAWSDIKR